MVPTGHDFRDQPTGRHDGGVTPTPQADSAAKDLVSLPVPSLPVPSLPVPSLSVPSLPVPSLSVPSLPVSSLPVLTGEAPPSTGIDPRGSFDHAWCDSCDWRGPGRRAVASAEADLERHLLLSHDR